MSADQGLSNLTLYDAKKYFRRAQNVVFNYTEMEAKVREATNNEPWGASSTLMEQVAQGTYNYREREEVLGMIFRRFTEKTASEWRQIYKALQLLEYLIRHGSERFIDDIRANLSLVKMLESFHYIDSQGRDQGINVRNRALELVKLLEDDSKIRSERKKARETAKKYKGVAGGAPSSYLPPSAANRTAGFGRSTNRGISVSADFDSDEEDLQENDARGGFKDNSPAALSNAHNDNNENDNNNHGGDEFNNDEDDEFADFQSAAPVTQPITSNSQAIFDAYSRTPLEGNKPNYEELNLFSTVSQPVATGPTPAVAQKKSDPFGSLFANAKHTTETSKPSHPVKPTPSSPQTTEQHVKEPNHEQEDDDGFGEMSAAMPAASTMKPASNGQEVDLLSF
ncbi:LANO_0B01508g1_1 [Lachancea nothofagi CBS 11611]|uniref:LANO_0B01508g1_1 n=1 Tax=Lachancea nothofagi CBS 11611 TaxID=1266666 RepID=A0A1G4IV34_9SACH|nr:LANO_0B01508g1_1 [Lachancea nothofagi CBS 11611]